MDVSGLVWYSLEESGKFDEPNSPGSPVDAAASLPLPMVCQLVKQHLQVNKNKTLPFIRFLDVDGRFYLSNLRARLHQFIFSHSILLCMLSNI